MNDLTYLNIILIVIIEMIPEFLFSSFILLVLYINRKKPEKQLSKLILFYIIFYFVGILINKILF
jgi:hypothetical protein